MRRLLILNLLLAGYLILLLCVSLPASAKFGDFFKKLFTRSEPKVSTEKKLPIDFYMAFASQANLHPTPSNHEQDEFKSAPKADLSGPILYEVSQVILQEFVKEQLGLLNKNQAIDLVLFGGNQAYSNEYYDFFRETVYDLQKYYIPSYIILGPNELKGKRDLSKLAKNKYYLLKTKGINILVLDNVTDTIVPEHVPEEANEQYIWLNKVLTELNKNKEDLLIFSYYPLDERTKGLLSGYTHLHIKLTASSEAKVFGYNSNTLNNPSLTSYPCSYSVITKDAHAVYKVEQKVLNLKAIQQLAKARSGIRR